MKKLCDWGSLNKLTISIQKTKYTIFKPKCYQNINHLATSLEINGNRIIIWYLMVFLKKNVKKIILGYINWENFINTLHVILQILCTSRQSYRYLIMLIS